MLSVIIVGEGKDNEIFHMKYVRGLCIQLMMNIDGFSLTEVFHKENP